MGRCHPPHLREGIYVGVPLGVGVIEQKTLQATPCSCAPILCAASLNGEWKVRAAIL